MHGEHSSHRNSLIGPLMMITVGSILLVGQFIPDMGFDKLWPVVIIAAGVATLLSRR